MPMINGIKMACEPCIRGHRSTKCNHANERVMLPVRKPGRPLSICPHPANNGCSCASVTAAIPRTRKCVCGTKASSSADAKTPRSPTKRPHFKAPTSPRSLARSRIDPGALERTDIGQINIHAPPSSWSNGRPATDALNMGSMAMPGVQPSGSSFMLPTEVMPYFPSQGESQTVFPPASGPFQNSYQLQGQGSDDMFPTGNADFSSYFGDGMDMAATFGDVQLAGADPDIFGLDLNQPATAYGTNPQASQINGFHGLPFPPPQSAPSNATAPMLATQPPLSAPAVPASRPCCAGSAQQPPAESPRHTPTSSTNSLTSNVAAANLKSCCSGSPVSSSAASSQEAVLKRETASGGSGSISLSSIPSMSTGDVKPTTNGAGGHVSSDPYSAVPLNPHVFSDYVQQENGAARWYRYRPEYGTVSAPLQPSQWRSLMATAASSAGLFTESLPFGAAPMQPSYPVPSGTAADAESHMCSCGDDCECVGCMAHPYNNATRSTVQSVWNLMDDATSTAPSAMTAMASATASATAAVRNHQMPSTDSASPQQVPTPSDASGASEEQISLPPSDFFFVRYPITDCAGEGLTCPCGDDCQCVGCAIHNNVPN